MEYQEKLDELTNIKIMDELINNIPGGIVVFEMQRNNIIPLFSNDQTYCLFGYSKEAFKTIFHSNVFEIVYQPDLALLQEKFYNAVKNYESFEHGSRCFRNDGSLMWVYFRVKYIGVQAGRNIFVALITDSSKKQRLEEKSRINEEMYHLAFNQSNVYLLEYDHQSKQISCSNEDVLMNLDSAAFSQMPESLIDSNLLHKQSYDEFYHFYHQIIGGVKTGEAKLKIRLPKNDKYVWIHVKFTNIFDDENQPIKAVGVYQNIDEQVQLESRYLQEIKYRQKLMQQTVMNIEINLSTDKVVKAHSVTYNIFGLDETASYSEFIKKMATFVAKEDRPLFLDTFEIDKVIQAYHEGKEKLRISFLFHRSIKGGYSWISAHMMFLFNEETEQLTGFFYANDIDDNKRKTIELEHQASTDVLTGLMNRRELQRMITSEIIKVDANNYGALFMIDVDNFKLVNDTKGHSAGDDTLRFVASNLKSLFRGDDVVGRFGGDEFMVYMKRIKSKSDLVAKAAQVSSALATTCPSNMIDISCSVGVTFVDDNRSTFDEIYHQADSAAYQAKKSGKRNYHIYE